MSLVFRDKVRPLHLPPKKEEGTALPPDEPDRTFRSVLWRRQVRPYGFRMSELD